MSRSPRSAPSRSALLRLLQALGIAPDMLAGHSYGEFVALYTAGVLDFEALMSSRRRAAASSSMRPRPKAPTRHDGGGAAPREAVEAAIADIDGVLIANHNAPTQSILSGTRAAVAAASRSWRRPATTSPRSRSPPPSIRAW